MQLAKLEYLSNEKTLLRKLNQITLGFLLELTHSKETLLFAYLNEVPFSSSVSGARAASEAYFHVSPAALSREQALRLILTIFNPALYSPDRGAPTGEAMVRAATIIGRARVFGPEIETGIARGFLAAPECGNTF
jgi:monofunctional biosynthetic peptidoglycan transglycosylase